MTRTCEVGNVDVLRVGLEVALVLRGEERRQLLLRRSLGRIGLQVQP